MGLFTFTSLDKVLLIVERDLYDIKYDLARHYKIESSAINFKYNGCCWCFYCLDELIGYCNYA